MVLSSSSGSSRCWDRGHAKEVLEGGVGRVALGVAVVLSPQVGDGAVLKGDCGSVEVEVDGAAERVRGEDFVLRERSEEGCQFLDASLPLASSF